MQKSTEIVSILRKKTILLKTELIENYFKKYDTKVNFKLIVDEHDGSQAVESTVPKVAKEEPKGDQEFSEILASFDQIEKLDDKEATEARLLSERMELLRSLDNTVSIAPNASFGEFLTQFIQDASNTVLAKGKEFIVTVWEENGEAENIRLKELAQSHSSKN